MGEDIGYMPNEGVDIPSCGMHREIFTAIQKVR